MGDLLAASAPSLKSWHMAFSQPSADPACSGHQCLSPRHSALPWQQLRGGRRLPHPVCGWPEMDRPQAKCQRPPPCLSLGSEAEQEAKPQQDFLFGGGRAERKAMKCGEILPQSRCP